MSSWPTWTPSALELHGEVGVVVDDEERAVGVRETAKRLPGALDHLRGMLPVAELDHPAPAGHGGVEKGLRVPFPGKGVADEVEPRPPQALPPQLTDRFGWREVRGVSHCKPSLDQGSRGYDGYVTGAHQGLRGRLKRRRPSEPDPGNAGAGRSMPAARWQTIRYDAIFVGGGVIGLACAWRAAERGARVCVLERDRPAAGATGVAAGMLAPVGEASWGEERSSNSTSSRCGAGRVLPPSSTMQAGQEIGFRRARSAPRRARSRRGRGAAPPLRAPSEPRPRRRVAARPASAGGSSRGSATAVRGGAHVPARRASIRGRWSPLCSRRWRAGGWIVHAGAEVVGRGT